MWFISKHEIQPRPSNFNAANMVAGRLLSVLVAVLIHLHKATCNCPVYGCTPSLSFTSETDIFTPTFTPKLQWRFQQEELKPTGAGCVTSAARVVCPMRYAENSSTVLISWDTVDDGKSSWNVPLKEKVSLPILDITGGLIASDGSELVGYTSEGTPFGKPVHLFPINGQVFDLQVSQGEFVILLYKCGFLAVYLTNGIPHASIWFNDTVGGVEGTFIPLSSPAITDQGQLYLLAAFRSNDPSTPSEGTYMRFYAMEIRGTAVERIKIRWYHDWSISGASIPFMDSNSTVCTTVPPEEADYSTHNQSSGHSAKVESEPTGIVLVQNDHVVAGFTYYILNTAYSEFFALVDKGNDSYHYLFSRAISSVISSMAYHDVAQKMNGNESAFGNMSESASVWVCYYDRDSGGDSVLTKVAISTGDVSTTIFASGLLDDDVYRARITTPLTIISYHKSRADKKEVPMVFGVTSDGTSKSYVVAVDSATTQKDHVKPLWTLPLSGKVIGQLSTVNEEKFSSLVVTDELGVSVYRLAG